MNYGATEATEEPMRATALERLDTELKRLDHTIGLLSDRLIPVSTAGGAELEQIRPSEDSSSPLEGRAIRLGELTGVIDRLIRNLDI